MPYCTQTDIQNLELSEKELLFLTDDTKLNQVGAAMITAAIAKADAEIDAYCQASYAVPFGPGSEVLGTDGKNYTCIVSHTSAALNKPITGANYATYWAQKGSAGAAWGSGTAYTAVPAIITGWSATLAAFNLYRNHPKPTTLVDRYNKVMSWLKAIAEGERSIPGLTAASYSSPGSTTEDAVQVFQRQQLDDGGGVQEEGTMETW